MFENKKISDMTLEELWKLFPIFLTKHKACWKDWYCEEERELKKILPSNAEVYHIGSTAINGIMAKPIIDILIEVSSDADLSEIAESVKSLGYIIMSDNGNRVSLNKGYTQHGFAKKVFHVHLQYKSEKREVLFRDYLNSYFNIAKEYENLKLDLWKKYEYNRDAYTSA